MRLSHLPALVTSLTALALAPSVAQAAAGVSSVAATPSSTQAGAHADFTIDMAFGADDDVRNLVIHLPKGFVGNPQAVGLCTQAQFNADACPARSQVGTTTVTATVTPNELLAPAKQTQQVSGRVYNLQPLAGEPARLGVLLPPAAALGGLVTTQPVRMQSVVSVRSNGDYGLDSTLANLPRTIDTNIGTLVSHIDRIQLSLRGRVAGASLPFLTNPTTCGAATTKVDTTTYGGATASSASSYTPTGCDAVPYAPKISATLDGAGPRQHPTVTTVVSQDADEATTQKVVATLPLGIAPDLAALSISCASADFDAGTCADNTKVGSATAVTPLLADPLTGPVYLVAPPGGGLPGLGIALGGLLPVKLHANVAISPEGRLVSTLDGLPDVPLSRFTLVLAGGDKGLLLSVEDLCATPRPIDGSFTSQSGMERTASATASGVNCSSARRGPAKPVAKNRRPKIRATLSKAGSLLVVATVPRGGSKLRRMRVALPKGLRADSAKRLRATRRAGAGRMTLRVAAKHLTVTRHKLAKRARVLVIATNARKRTFRVRVALRR
jgi:hypothetical protein